jgi:Cys-rich protein (TIGR01571 family)
MPCLYADNAARIDGDSTPYCVDCFSYALLMPLGCCCLVAGTKRSVMRKAFRMPESGIGPIKDDKMVHFCCPCCALLQEKSALDRNQCSHFAPACSYMVRGSNDDKSAEMGTVGNPVAKANGDSQVDAV